MSPEREIELIDRFLDVTTGKKASRALLLFAGGLTLIIGILQIARWVS